MANREITRWIILLVKKILGTRADLAYLLSGEGADPFQWDATDPAKSKSGSTFLHELVALKNHWDPIIAEHIVNI
jgi:hypothetical protein